MPAYLSRQDMVRPRERIYALAAVMLIQIGLWALLLRGFHVDLLRPSDVVQQLINVSVAKPPPAIVPIRPPPKPKPHQAAAPKAAPAPLGGSPGPRPAHAPPSVTPILTVRPSAAPSGGGTGSGPAAGSG